MPAIGQAFVKLNPATLIKNPVMFVLEIVTVLTTILLIRDLVQRHGGIGFELPDRVVAVVHRAVRQFCGSGGGRPRQGAGRHVAQAAHETRAKRFCPDKRTSYKASRRDLRAGDLCRLSRPATSFPAMAT